VLRSRRNLLLLALAAVALGLAPVVGAAHPRTKEIGRYDLTISGFYSGSGLAFVTSAGVTIRADLTDEDGNTYKFQSQRLSRDPDRHYLFRGEGTLGGKLVTIDGRVDTADDRKSEVLQVGRIVFTFKVPSTGHHGRGVGEKKSGGAKGPGSDVSGSGGGSGKS
jgi:hypothetical protein